MNSIKEKIKHEVLSDTMAGELTDDQLILQRIDEHIMAIPQYISVSDKIRLRNDVYNSLRRYDVLSDLLEDDSIRDIMINGAGNIFIERNGRLEK